MSKEKKEVSKKKNSDLFSKMRDNPWMLSTIVIGLLFVFSIVGTNVGSSVSVSEDVVKSNALDFLNSKAEGEVVIDSVSNEGSYYELMITYDGNQFPVQVTLDGNYLMTGLVPIGEGATAPSQPNAPSQPQPTYSEEDLVKIKDFSQCLADNGVKAYGAGWCGYCKKFKEAFGGAAQIEPFYLECQNADRTDTEYAELCQQEQISGFPTIKINGELYSGARTIEGLAAAVDECEAPSLEGSVATTDSATAGCGS